jgi:hypothetical protein
MRGQRDSTLINKIINEKGNIATESEEIQNIIRSYYKSLYLTILENLEEMDDFPRHILYNRVKSRASKLSKHALVP